MNHDASSSQTYPTFPSKASQAYSEVIKAHGAKEDSCVWKSPALKLGARTSFGSFVDQALDPFADDDGFVLGRGRKRTKFARDSGKWRYIESTPSPEKSDHTLPASPEIQVLPQLEKPSLLTNGLDYHHDEEQVRGETESDGRRASFDHTTNHDQNGNALHAMEEDSMIQQSDEMGVQDIQSVDQVREPASIMVHLQELEPTQSSSTLAIDVQNAEIPQGTMLMQADNTDTTTEDAPYEGTSFTTARDVNHDQAESEKAVSSPQTPAVSVSMQPAGHSHKLSPSAIPQGCRNSDEGDFQDQLHGSPVSVTPRIQPLSSASLPLVAPLIRRSGAERGCFPDRTGRVSELDATGDSNDMQGIPEVGVTEVLPDDPSSHLTTVPGNVVGVVGANRQRSPDPGTVNPFEHQYVSVSVHPDAIELCDERSQRGPTKTLHDFGEGASEGFLSHDVSTLEVQASEFAFRHDAVDPDTSSEDGMGLLPAYNHQPQVDIIGRAVGVVPDSSENLQSDSITPQETIVEQYSRTQAGVNTMEKTRKQTVEQLTDAGEIVTLSVGILSFKDGDEEDSGLARREIYEDSDVGEKKPMQELDQERELEPGGRRSPGIAAEHSVDGSPQSEIVPIDSSLLDAGQAPLKLAQAQDQPRSPLQLAQETSIFFDRRESLVFSAAERIRSNLSTPPPFERNWHRRSSVNSSRESFRHNPFDGANDDSSDVDVSIVRSSVASSASDLRETSSAYEDDDGSQEAVDSEEIADEVVRSGLENQEQDEHVEEGVYDHAEDVRSKAQMAIDVLEDLHIKIHSDFAYPMTEAANRATIANNGAFSNEFDPPSLRETESTSATIAAAEVLGMKDGNLDEEDSQKSIFQEKTSFPAEQVQYQLATPDNTQQDEGTSQAQIPASSILHLEKLVPTPQNTQRTDDAAPIAREAQDSENMLEIERFAGMPPRTLSEIHASKRLTTSPLSQRLSLVPDGAHVLSPYFTPRRSNQMSRPVVSSPPSGDVSLLITDHEGAWSPALLCNESNQGTHGSVVSTHPHSPLASCSGIKTPLSYYASLSSLAEHFSQSVDVLAICTTTHSEPQRAKMGPRDWHTTFHLTDPSMTSGLTVIAQFFRPYKHALPTARKADIVLLRAMKVQSQKRRCMLLSTESSAWAIFTTKDRLLDGKAALPLDTNVSGPPIEYGMEEEIYAEDLRRWWNAEGAERRLAYKNNESQGQEPTEQAGKEQHTDIEQETVSDLRQRSDVLTYGHRDESIYHAINRPSIGGFDLVRGDDKLDTIASKLFEEQHHEDKDAMKIKHVLTYGSNVNTQQTEASRSIASDLEEASGSISESHEDISTRASARRKGNRTDHIENEDDHLPVDHGYPTSPVAPNAQQGICQSVDSDADEDEGVLVDEYESPYSITSSPDQDAAHRTSIDTDEDEASVFDDNDSADLKISDAMPGLDVYGRPIFGGYNPGDVVLGEHDSADSIPPGPNQVTERASEVATTKDEALMSDTDNAFLPSPRAFLEPTGNDPEVDDDDILLARDEAETLPTIARSHDKSQDTDVVSKDEEEDDESITELAVSSQIHHELQSSNRRSDPARLSTPSSLQGRKVLAAQGDTFNDIDDAPGMPDVDDSYNNGDIRNVQQHESSSTRHPGGRSAGRPRGGTRGRPSGKRREGPVVHELRDGMRYIDEGSPNPAGGSARRKNRRSGVIHELRDGVRYTDD